MIHKAVEVLRRVPESEFARFCVVGFSGVFVNLGAYVALTRIFGWPITLASPLAIELSILWCFHWNESWTFDAREKDTTFWGRLARFHTVAAGGGAANYAILLVLVESFGLYDVLANLVGIAVSVLMKFLANSLWTWREAPARAPSPRRPAL